MSGVAVAEQQQALTLREPEPAEGYDCQQAQRNDVTLLSIYDCNAIEAQLYNAARCWVRRERVAQAATVCEAAIRVEQFEQHVVEHHARLYSLVDQACTLTGADLFATTLQELAAQNEFYDLGASDYDLTCDGAADDDDDSINS
jgi:hypothetical protein